MAWNFEGTYFESCSCTTPCPCSVSFALGADFDYCRGVFFFNIASGDVDGVDVGGTAVAMVFDTPKVMTDGGWKVGLYISDSASDEQTEALGSVFSGQLGGPPAVLAPLLGEFRGIEKVPMEVTEDGLVHTLRIGDSVDIEVEDVVPSGSESGVPAQLTNVLHPAGATLTISKPRRSTINAFGIETEGHSGVSKSDFAWSS